MTGPLIPLGEVGAGCEGGSCDLPDPVGKTDPKPAPASPAPQTAPGNGADGGQDRPAD